MPACSQSGSDDEAAEMKNDDLEKEEKRERKPEREAKVKTLEEMREKPEKAPAQEKKQGAQLGGLKSWGIF